MKKGIVVAVNIQRQVFAVRTGDGTCAVFCRSAGVEVVPGDLLSGAVTARGVRPLRHRDGTCWAVGDTGPIGLKEALDIVGGEKVMLDCANDDAFESTIPSSSDLSNAVA